MEKVEESELWVSGVADRRLIAMGGAPAAAGTGRGQHRHRRRQLPGE